MLRPIRFALIASLAFSTASAGAAELKGKLVLKGDAPASAPVADPKAEGDFPGQKLVYENFVVDPASKGIANIAVYVRNPTVTITPEAEKAAADAAEVVIDNKGGQFHPHITGLWTGKQKLLFKNSDPVGHNSNFPFAAVNPLLPPNAKIEVPVAGAKPIPQELTCNIHPWMKAYIVARENPYIAISGADGSFTIKNLPAGEELEIQFWHEKAGYLVAKPEWDKGRLKVTLTGDQDLGEIPVDAGLFNK